MMDPSNINNFEEQWRKALKEASEAPPPSVWEGIEARLDGEREKVVPLWWQSPKMWYAAASIAALLIVGGGIWYSGSQDGKVEVAVSTKALQKAETEPAKPLEEQTNAVQGDNKEQLAATTEQNGTAPASGEPARNNRKGEIAGTASTGIAGLDQANARSKRNLPHSDGPLPAGSVIQEQPASNHQNAIAGKAPVSGAENSDIAIAAVQNEPASAEMFDVIAI